MNRYIAVYGTLRPGDYNYERFKNGNNIINHGETRIPGFKMYDLGSYPTVILAKSDNSITINLLEVKDDTFEDINRMELSAGYFTYNISIFGVKAILYVMKNAPKGSKLISTGDWFNKEPEKIKRNIYVIGGANAYANWMEGNLVDSIEEADLVVFTGGEDVDPTLYKEPEHYTTKSNIDRDRREQELFEKAVKLGKSILGVCRGSQFTCVMNGGKLVQHMTHYAFEHNIVTKDGLILNATNTHHQMQYPFNLPEKDYDIIAWAEKPSEFHLDGDNQEMKTPKDCEIVFYPKTKSLAIQMHPEMMNLYKNDTIIYLRNLLDKLFGINEKLNEEDNSEVSEVINEAI